MVLLDTGTPGTSREIFSEDADNGTRTRNPSRMPIMGLELATPRLRGLRVRVPLSAHANVI